ncbi:TonB family protein [Flavisphingomonas formosensis]|uniref:TonB family protein n=1 Tax=Flavisphingomonas formosensis TaxID=861534 RepID=UPI0012F9DEE0
MFSMLMIAALEVAQGPTATDLSQPPRLRNPQAPITAWDYPAEASPGKDYGIATIFLRVSTEGRVTSCDVTESSGSTILDMTTCSLLKKRAQFEPAKNASGSPVEGEYRSAISWGINDHQPTTSIDIELQVSSIPRSYRSPVKAKIIFGATGHVTTCEITATSGSSAADRVACTYITQHVVITAPQSASRDIPPVAVRYLTASLSTQAVETPQGGKSPVPPATSIRPASQSR